jgi:hypothetical protein
MTPDLDLLKESLTDLDEIVGAMDLELVDDPRWAGPSDTSYLTEEDRANPDIAANVEAMAQTNTLIAWFGRDSEGFVGLWRGPENTPLPKCPVVRLDSEGQYEVIANSIGDYLLTSVEEDIADARETLIEAGFDMSESSEGAWDAIADSGEVNDYRHELYNEGRKKRGLEPIALR